MNRIEIKTCAWCKKSKPLSQFWKRESKNSIMYRNECKECSRPNRNKYNSTLKGRYFFWKSHANQRGIHWNLKLIDLEKLPMICYYTGKPLTFDVRSYYTVSLDRLDS